MRDAAGAMNRYLLPLFVMAAGHLLPAVLPPALRAQERLGDARYCTFDGRPPDDDVYVFSAAADAEAAVRRVVELLPLPLNVEVKAANVPAITAAVSGDRRLILYDTYFLERLGRADSTDWAAWGMLAHAVAHHVLPDGLAADLERPLAEIEADRLAGALLYRLGASARQAQYGWAAADAATDAAAYATHPARALRLAAVLEGWTQTEERAGAEIVAFLNDDREGGVGAGAVEGEGYPRFWPPPRPSVAAVVPMASLLGCAAGATLRDVGRRLETLLGEAGYDERSYYAVPDGFALVARLEQIHPDGTPKEPPDRWSLAVRPMTRFSIIAYFRALFAATPGHFRIITFVVTPHPFTAGRARVEQQEAQAWLSEGLNTLPAAIGALPLTDAYACTALVYEFERRTVDHPVRFKDPSALTAVTHLKKAHLWP